MKKLKYKPKKLIKKKFISAKKLSEDEKLRRILDANPDEEIENGADEIVIKKRVLGRKFYFAVGMVMIVLSAIGLVSTVRFSARKISDIVNNTAQKNEFADIIYPLVLCDPAPFENSEMLHPQTTVMSACWKIILDGDTERYEKEFDYMTVPAADVEQAAVKLYGDNVSVANDSIINSDFGFYFSSQKDSYRIPVSPKYFSYSPRIESISKLSDGGYVLEVGYMAATPAWFTASSDIKAKPEKYMIYTLQKNSDGYYISSVKLSDRNVSGDSGL